jgi:AcrR family transcriptional regulator
MPSARRGTSGRARVHTRPPQAAEAGPLLPPRATANGTLRKLLEAALIGFAERGYHGVSTRDLAAATGVRPSSVYAHVRAKEDILLELTLIGHGEHNERLRKAVLAAGSDPRDQITAVVREHVAVHATYPLLTRVCNRELHALSPANAERVMAVRDDSTQLLVDVIARGVETGVFHCDDVWLAAAAIGAMGIRVAEWFEPGGPIAVEEVSETYAQLARKMLA